MSLTVGSLFSGIGGFDLGLERAGHQVVWQVEADAQARSVLRRHWPTVDLHEDVRNVGRSNLAPVDLICGGFPCQDLSVAGRRAGLDGARSGLWHEFHRIVGELVPRWVLVENVPGLLSSNGGADLAVILRGLAGLGYVGAWRCVDSQYFGLAQRRKRVFLLACRDPRDGCPAEVLAIAEGLSGHPAPSREAGEGVAGGITTRAGNASRQAGAHGNVVGALRAETPGRGGVWADDEHVVSNTLSAHSGIHDAKGQTFVAHTLRAEGHDASEDGTGRGVPLVASAFQWQASPSQSMNPAPVSPALDKSKGVATLAFDTTQVTSAGNYSRPKPGDPCHPLAAGAHPPAVTGATPRRLTPKECERLQGFPDDWTCHGATPDSEPVELADSPRYRMLGNAVSVDVAYWIGSRLP